MICDNRTFKITTILSHRFVSVLIQTLLVSGCSTFFSDGDESPMEVPTETYARIQDPDASKNIFIFFDGTANDATSKTNVWRLFKALPENKDQQLLTKYIAGVGTTDSEPLTGPALGRGMEERILIAYEFISKVHNNGDRIYIFGFSRGAHQARALAGLLSYAGVQVTPQQNSDTVRYEANSIIDFLKDKNDEDYKTQWADWTPGNPPLVAGEIKEKYKLDMRSVEIDFLGVWDTVPGSFFKKYLVCKEKIGFFKRNFHWIPGISKGHRYKSDSYPPIHNLAHAVSIDERRSKFTPILLCPAIDSEKTKIHESWFPGAHADVGGGYDDSKFELPNISLSWMVDQLNDVYTPRIHTEFQGKADGLAHWSMGDSPANTGSECVDRKIPEGANIHVSFEQRKLSAPVRIRRSGKISPESYPLEPC